MSINSELRELILLRILGVLLVLVGFVLLARNVRSGTSEPDAAAAMAAQSNVDHRCRHVHVEVHSIAHPVPLPGPSLPILR